MGKYWGNILLFSANVFFSLGNARNRFIRAGKCHFLFFSVHWLYADCAIALFIDQSFSTQLSLRSCFPSAFPFPAASVDFSFHKCCQSTAFHYLHFMKPTWLWLDYLSSCYSSIDFSKFIFLKDLSIILSHLIWTKILPVLMMNEIRLDLYKVNALLNFLQPFFNADR